MDIGVAWLVKRLLISKMLGEQIPPDLSNLDAVLVEVVARTEPVWTEMGTAAVRRVAGEDQQDLAEDYARHLGIELDSVSGRALKEGYTASLSRGIDRTLSWARVAEAWGLDGAQMRAYIGSMPTEGYQKDPVPAHQKAILETMLNTRADRIKENEEWGIEQIAKQIQWIKMQKTGEISPESKKRWHTALDERVCPTCGPLHKQTAETTGTFKVGEIEIFAPPVHPNCRCWVELDPVEVVTKRQYKRDEDGKFARVNTLGFDMSKPEGHPFGRDTYGNPRPTQEQIDYAKKNTRKLKGGKGGYDQVAGMPTTPEGDILPGSDPNWWSPGSISSASGESANLLHTRDEKYYQRHYRDWYGDKASHDLFSPDEYWSRVWSLGTPYQYKLSEKDIFTAEEIASRKALRDAADNKTLNELTEEDLMAHWEWDPSWSGAQGKWEGKYREFHPSPNRPPISEHAFFKDWRDSNKPEINEIPYKESWGIGDPDHPFPVRADYQFSTDRNAYLGRDWISREESIRPFYGEHEAMSEVPFHGISMSAINESERRSFEDAIRRTNASSNPLSAERQKNANEWAAQTSGKFPDHRAFDRTADAPLWRSRALLMKSGFNKSGYERRIAVENARGFTTDYLPYEVIITDPQPAHLPVYGHVVNGKFEKRPLPNGWQVGRNVDYPSGWSAFYTANTGKYRSYPSTSYKRAPLKLVPLEKGDVQGPYTPKGTKLPPPSWVEEVYTTKTGRVSKNLMISKLATMVVDREYKRDKEGQFARVDTLGNGGGNRPPKYTMLDMDSPRPSPALPSVTPSIDPVAPPKKFEYVVDDETLRRIRERTGKIPERQVMLTRADINDLNRIVAGKTVRTSPPQPFMEFAMSVKAPLYVFQQQPNKVITDKAAKVADIIYNSKVAAGKPPTQKRPPRYVVMDMGDGKKPMSLAVKPIMVESIPMVVMANSVPMPGELIDVDELSVVFDPAVHDINEFRTEGKVPVVIRGATIHPVTTKVDNFLTVDPTIGALAGEYLATKSGLATDLGMDDAPIASAESVPETPMGDMLDVRNKSKRDSALPDAKYEEIDQGGFQLPTGYGKRVEETKSGQDDELERQTRKWLADMGEPDTSVKWEYTPLAYDDNFVKDTDEENEDWLPDED